METDSAAPTLLSRAFNLLRLLAGAGRAGEGLAELARRSGLPHGTVHRLLRQLAAQRMVIQLEHSKRYALGPLAHELGVAAYPHDLRPFARPVLARLARQTEDSAFLSLRSGDEAVCIDLEPAPSPIRVVTLEVGTRRPLGVGAGGLAILAALEPDERAAVADRLVPVLARAWRLSKAALHASIAGVERDGFALVSNRLHAGVGAVGYPVRGALGQPIAAVSIATLNERLGARRIDAVVAALKGAAHELELSIRRSTRGPA